MNEIVIDGTNALLGRLASYAAKQAILGRKVGMTQIINILPHPRKNFHPSE